MLEISKQTARRYCLGRQGLWPGRRWQGIDGTAAAITAGESVQVDTISVIARNHELVLWSRVWDYKPEYLQELLYTQRKYFEYGSILFVYPVAELPYWQAIMNRSTAWREQISQAHTETILEVREELRSKGSLSSRDFKSSVRVPGGYDTIKNTGKALQYLWLTGEIMIAKRRGIDKLYDFATNLIPAKDDEKVINLADAEFFFAAKTLRDCGLATAAEHARRLSSMLHHRTSPTHAKQWLEANKQAASLKIEDRKEIYYYLAEDTALLKELAAGKIPSAWQALHTTTDQEVNFIAPLDNLIWDRARLKNLFDFDYVWEVYKPAPIRRWGYYTLPILYQDRLVARLDPKLDRKTKKLSILQFWLDESDLQEDEKFWQALAYGLKRFANFHQAQQLDLTSLPTVHKQQIEKYL